MYTLCINNHKLNEYFKTLGNLFTCATLLYKCKLYLRKILFIIADCF